MRAHAACSGGGPLSEMFKVILKITMIKLIVICPRCYLVLELVLITFVSLFVSRAAAQRQIRRGASLHTRGRRHRLL